MNVMGFAACAALAVLALAACEQTQRTTQTAPPSAPASVSSSAPAPRSTAPDPTAKDPSVPPADVAMSADKSEVSPQSAMTTAERDRQMPMKGQVNDYNTPDRAKEGDQPNTASKEPGGQEAKPGNGPPESPAAPRSQ